LIDVFKKTCQTSSQKLFDTRRVSQGKKKKRHDTDNCNVKRPQTPLPRFEKHSLGKEQNALPLTYLEHLHPTTPAKTPFHIVQILLLSPVLMVHFAVVILTPLKAFFYYGFGQ
jgi:hypothetical protein